MTNYEKQAKEFCEKYHVEFKAEFFANMPYFEDDKEKRDVYAITLKRGEKEYSFKFGQSLRASNKTEQLKKLDFYYGKNKLEKMREINKRCVPPTEYDVLSCITNYDPEDFETFCANYGYSTDSRKAEKVYFAVQKEYREIYRLFSDCMDELREIQ